MARRKPFGEDVELPPDFEIEDEDSSEPAEDDLITSDHSEFYQNGRLRLTVDPDADELAMWKAIDAHMKKSNFYPNVWFVSDHGNAHLMERPKRRRR